MNKRNEYYVFQPDYYRYEELRRLIEKKDSVAAMKYFVSHSLPVNLYMRANSDPKGDLFVPLIYKTLQTKELHEFSLYLLKHGAKFKLEPDGDEYPDLLFTCHTKYVPWLIKKGATVSHPDVGIKKCLMVGNWERLQLLISSGMITAAQVTYEQEQPYQMIKTAVHYLTFFYTQAIKHESTGGEPPSLKGETDKTIEKYRKTFELFPPKEIKPEVIQLCVDYYLYEILQVLDVTYSDNPPVYNQKGTITAVVRPLLNDARYEKTCKQLGIPPSDMLTG